MANIDRIPPFTPFDKRTCLCHAESLQAIQYGIAGISRTLINTADEPPKWMNANILGGLYTALEALQASSAFHIECLIKRFQEAEK